jgi:hypothetical protein
MIRGAGADIDKACCGCLYNRAVHNGSSTRPCSDVGCNDRTVAGRLLPAW